MTGVIKYIVHPGYVTSKWDGQHHFICATDLMKLYQVNPVECLVCPSVDDSSREARIARELLLNREGVTHLYPRRNGNYTIPHGDCK